MKETQRQPSSAEDQEQARELDWPNDVETPLEPPDLETLMEWEAEGGCEAACPHSCWVEPDGTCTHGHPSWLLKLGMI
jgi:hypothetical protein